MVQRFAVDHRVGATGVVADASADAGAAGGGGVGRVLHPKGGKLPVELVEDDAGLDPCPAFFGVDLQHLVQVFAEVEDYGMVDRLAGQAGPAAPGQHRDIVLPGNLHHRQHIVHVPGNHHSHRLHLVDAGVGTVQHPGKGVETDLSGDPLPQYIRQFFSFFTVNPGCRGGDHGHLFGAFSFQLSVVSLS